MNSFKLQKLLKDLSDVDLVSYTDVDNYQLNGKWVTDINRNYYEEIASGIAEILQEDLSIGEYREIKTSLQEAKQKSLQKWRDVTTGSNDVHTIIKYYSPVKPVNSTLDFLHGKEQEERRTVVFDTVKELWKLDLDKISGEDLHSYLLSTEASNTERDIKFKYAYGHLYYVLSVRVEIIDSLLKEVEEVLDDSNYLNPMKNSGNKPYSIEFNLKKIDIALFFNILYEEGIIRTEGKNVKGRKTHLKKYIDNANIFYLDDKKRTQVNRINKEFTKIESPEYYRVNEDEKLLLGRLNS